MNRRSFLKGLATLGVSAVVADKLVALAEADALLPAPIELAQIRPPADVFWLDTLHILGSEDVSRPVDFSLLRAGSPLIKFRLDALGGLIYWRAIPGTEIVAMKAHPLSVEGNFDGIVSAVGFTDKGPLMHQFIMTRGKGPVGRIHQLEAQPLSLSAA